MTNTLPTTSTELTAAAAARLADASRTGVPCAPVRDLIGSDDLDLAYRVQEINVEQRIADGATLVGRKIGATSQAVRDQLGVDQPDFGFLFDDMVLADGGVLPAGTLIQPKAEAEIAFVLGADLDAAELDLAAVRAAVSHAVVALEICDSRIENWNITFGDTVADNASAGAYVLGAQQVTLEEFEPRETTMTMEINGETVSAGTGDACLGDPLEAVLWLARASYEFGQPLRAGQVVLSGALGPMRPVAPGDTVRATVSSLGTVEFTLAPIPEAQA